MNLKLFTFQIALQEQGSIVFIAGLYGLFQPLKKMRMAYMPSLLTQGFCRYFCMESTHMAVRLIW